MNTPPAIIEGEAARAGQRAFAKTLGWYVALGLLACTIYVIVLGYNLTRVAEAFGRGSRCGGCRGAAEGSAVRRAGQPLAAIRQIAAPARGRQQWMLLAPASRRAIDSARTGLLRATLTAGGDASSMWTVELVSPTSGTPGEVVALLVTTPGLPPIPVYANPATQPAPQTSTY